MVRKKEMGGPPHEQDAPNDHATGTPAAPRLLLVSGSRARRATVRDLLQHGKPSDITVIEADSGAAALLTYQECLADCLIVDRQLPDIDGIAFISGLVTAGLRRAPAILLSDGEDADAEATALAAGAQDCLALTQLGSHTLQRAVHHAMLRHHCERRGRAVMNTATDALLMFDAAGIVRSFNPAAEPLFGVAADEIIGRDIERILPGLFRAATAMAAEPDSTRQVPATRRELVAHRSDGTAVPVEVTVTALLLGGQPFFTANVRDLRERKRSENLFRIAIEAAPNGVLLVDADGVIRLANPYAETLFNYPRGGLTGRAVEELIPTAARDEHRRQRDQFTHDQRARAMGGNRVLRGIKRTGEQIPLEIGLSPLEMETGRAVMVTIVDVSERLRAEHAYRLFLAATSHDVRNTLTAILGHVNVLASGATGETAARSITRISSMVSGLAIVMNDMVGHARAADQQVEWQTVNIRSLLAASVAEIQPQCEEKGIELAVSLPKSTRIRTDPAMLARIVQNLLVNSIRYTNAGTIELRAECAGAALRITVRDTGVGIAAASLPHVFEEYYRDPVAQEMVPLGTGLGLPTVKRFCEMLGGSVAIHSTPGSGTTVEIVLPVNQPE